MARTSMNQLPLELDGQVLHLDAHNAVVWSEKRTDGKWRCRRTNHLGGRPFTLEHFREVSRLVDSEFGRMTMPRMTWSQLGDFESATAASDFLRQLQVP